MTKPFSDREVKTFFERLEAMDPEPKSELVYTSPYTLLVAVVLTWVSGLDYARSAPELLRGREAT